MKSKPLAKDIEASRDAPTAIELATAPRLEGWMQEDADAARPWLYGFFVGHPEISDGKHGHTSPIVEIDNEMPPRWARTESRLYTLGTTYSPAEREIRYWSEKLRRWHGLPFAGIPGGSNDVEGMLVFIRSRRSYGMRESREWKMPTEKNRNDKVLAVRPNLVATCTPDEPHELQSDVFKAIRSVHLMVRAVQN
ncbi:DUF6634 family protein [Rhizobium sp.]|uniref:DUF6634 family protein n=1 Tax=Rhizobium sp. TaxID=391 RepID=UPI0034C64C87